VGGYGPAVAGADDVGVAGGTTESLTDLISLGGAGGVGASRGGGRRGAVPSGQACGRQVAPARD